MPALHPTPHPEGDTSCFQHLLQGFHTHGCLILLPAEELWPWNCSLPSSPPWINSVPLLIERTQLLSKQRGGSSLFISQGKFQLHSVDRERIPRILGEGQCWHWQSQKREYHKAQTSSRCPRNVQLGISCTARFSMETSDAATLRKALPSSWG